MALTAGHADVAANVIIELLSRWTSGSERLHCLLGRHYLAAGEIALASREFSFARQCLPPGSALAHLDQGLLAIAENRYGFAKNYFTSAVSAISVDDLSALTPQDIDALVTGHNNLA
eukprot:3870390-Amphidinium_carterae.1